MPNAGRERNRSNLPEGISDRLTRRSKVPESQALGSDGAPSGVDGRDPFRCVNNVTYAGDRNTCISRDPRDLRSAGFGGREEDLVIVAAAERGLDQAGIALNRMSCRA
jgi:hypothetical protein